MGTRGEANYKTLEDCFDLNMQGWDLYFIPNRVKDSFVGVKPRDADMAGYHTFIVDYDKPTSPDFAPQAGEILVSIINGYCMRDVCRCWVYTGNGIQVHIPLFDWVPDGQRRIAKWLRDIDIKGVDTCTSDVSRMVRLPYTINWKTKVRGSVCHTLVCVGLKTSSLPESTALITPVGGNLTNLSTLAPRLTVTAARFLLEGESGPRHSAAYSTARTLCDLGVDIERAMEWVKHGASICKVPLDEKEAEHCVRTAYKA